MFRQIEESDKISSAVAESAALISGCESSLAKVAHLEFSLENLTEGDDDLISIWKNKVFDMIERIEHFEDHYLDQ
jgi:hypothetical protein